MTNPYEPSHSVETPTLSPTPTPQSTSFYMGGGFLTIAAISLVIGGVVGALILGIGRLPPIAIFGIPAIGWLCATALLTFLIRDQSFTNSGRVALAILLPIPAYVLYIPVCGFASMATTPFLGGVEYGPTTGGAAIGSAFAFFLILMIFAGIVRFAVQKRMNALPSQSRQEP